MSEQTSRNGAGETGGTYEVRLQGHLHDRWTAWFDGFTVSNHADGIALLRGDVIDQSALHGLLRRLADLGLPLLSLTRTGAATAGTAATACTSTKETT